MHALESENLELKERVAALEIFVKNLEEYDRINRAVEGCLIETNELLIEDNEAIVLNNEAQIRSLEEKLGSCYERLRTDILGTKQSSDHEVDLPSGIPDTDDLQLRVNELQQGQKFSEACTSAEKQIGEFYRHQSISLINQYSSGYAEIINFIAGSVSVKSEVAQFLLKLDFDNVLRELPNSIGSYVDFKITEKYIAVLRLSICLLELRGASDYIVGVVSKNPYIEKASFLNGTLVKIEESLNSVCDLIKRRKYLDALLPALSLSKSIPDIISNIIAEQLPWKLGSDLMIAHESFNLINIYMTMIKGISDIATNIKRNFSKYNILSVSTVSDNIFSPILGHFKRHKQFLLPEFDGKLRVPPVEVQSSIAELTRDLLQSTVFFEKVFSATIASSRDNPTFSMINLTSKLALKDHQEKGLVGKLSVELAGAKEIAFFIENSTHIVTKVALRSLDRLSETMANGPEWTFLEAYQAQEDINGYGTANHTPPPSQNSRVALLEEHIAALNEKNTVLEKRLKEEIISRNAAYDQIKTLTAKNSADCGRDVDLGTAPCTLNTKKYTSSDRVNFGKLNALENQKRVLEDYIFYENYKLLFEKSDPVMTRGMWEISSGSHSNIQCSNPIIVHSIFKQAGGIPLLSHSHEYETSAVSILKLLNNIASRTERICYLTAKEISLGEVIDLSRDNAEAYLLPRDGTEISSSFQKAISAREHLAELIRTVLLEQTGVSRTNTSGMEYKFISE